MNLWVFNIPNQLLDIGKVAALIGIPYLIGTHRQSRQFFAFDFAASSGKENPSNNYIVSTIGIIKNRSNLENSITKIYLVVWKNKKKNSFLRYGYAGISLKDLNSKKPPALPLYFQKREAKSLEIAFNFPIKGTSDEKLVSELVEIRKGSGLYLHKYHYEICFEDVDGYLFDQQGNLRNIDEANLWWTLENTFAALKEWNILPFAKHSMLIVLSKIKFKIKLLLWNLGLK